MSLKRLTNRNFLPSKGVQPIPVYAEYYNEMYDAVYTLNARAHHSMDPSRIIKYPLMAVAVWDYAINGGSTGIANLNSSVNFLPDNAVIRNVFYDIKTQVVVSGTTGNLVFKLPTDGTLINMLVAYNTGSIGGTGVGLGTPQNSTAGTWIKTTAARGVQADLTGTGPTFTAGKVYCYIEYVVSELEPSGLASL